MGSILSNTVRADTESIITNKLNYLLQLNLEKHADVQIKVEHRNYNKEYLDRDLTTINFSKDISLGESVDSGSCIKYEDYINKGICLDGVYKLITNVFDSAGNNSSKEIFINRDTVAPVKPQGKLVQCGNNICLELNNSEPGSTLLINEKVRQDITSNYIYFRLLSSFQFNKKYTFNIGYRDKAGNTSENLPLTFYKEQLGQGGADGEDLNEWYEDYQYFQNKNTFGNIGNIEIDYKGNIKINELNIATPWVQGGSINLFTGKTSLYGLAFNTGRTQSFKGNVKKTYYSYLQAKSECGFEGTSSWKLCMSDKMGYNLQEFTHIYSEILQCSNTFTCSDQYTKVEEEYSGFSIIFSNVELLAYKNGGGVTQFRECNVGTQCFDEAKRYWHGDNNGEWQLEFPNNIFKEGDFFQASIKLFGEAVLNYKDNDFKVDFGNNGIESSKSKEYMLPIGSMFQEKNVIPIQDSSCDTARISDIYGKRYSKTLGWRWHDGLDIAKHNGCIINNVFDGQAISKWYAGKTVEIKHDNEFSTLYGHGDYYFGNYPRFSETGQKIMYMGNTGNSTGTHLHFEVHQNGEVVDPLLYFKERLQKYDEYNLF